MPITSMNGLVAAARQRRTIRKASLTAEGAGTYHSLWKALGFPEAGATPATGNGAVPTKATGGAIPFSNPAGSQSLYLAGVNGFGLTSGMLIIYDRLWHNSGFVGNLTSAQTIGTPPTLTRPDALGAEVELWGEVYTAMGATGSTFTATYTDQDGNTGNSATYVHPANALSVGQMFPFDLAAGDSGVRTVTQVQLSISTGTAGDFGLVLLRRIAEIPLGSPQVRDFFELGGPQVYSDACLAMMVLCSTTSTGDVPGSVVLAAG